MRPLFVRDAARTDLEEAVSWYEERRPGLGSEFIAAVRYTLEAVESNPEQYPIAVDDIRKAPLRRFPYVVYYVALESDVSVIAVMHSRRHPRRWQERR
jgi:toxin ParE1/3/4